MASQSVGNDDQKSRTCSEVSGGGGNGFMLFGVRVVEAGSFRKSASTNNLAQYEQAQDSHSTNDVAAAGYVSDDIVHRSRHRKRGKSIVARQLPDDRSCLSFSIVNAFIVVEISSLTT